MMLYLVHHGDAVGPKVDSMQPLSERGRLDVDKVAQAAAARGAKPLVIWHSGKARARQTAEAFWHGCNPQADLSVMPGLQPMDPPDRVRDALIGEDRDVMVVGHFPHLGLLLRLLVHNDPDASGVDFPLHGLVALEREGQGWVERWRIGGTGL
jgi:phosphohistidine phosphatase